MHKIMKTPAQRQFLESVGRLVHHLNTIAVGLSAVESGAATKPPTMDISWHPSDLRASSRSARAFALNAAIVFVGEKLCSYVTMVKRFPACSGLCFSKDASRADRFSELAKWFSIPNNHIVLGPLLLLHWRNKIIHGRSSNANLTNTERLILVESSEQLILEYKNLDPKLLLQHFDNQTPTLKDVSSLIAMTINCVKRIEGAVPEPSNLEEVNSWIESLNLVKDLDRIKRVSAAKGKQEQGVINFFATHCPELADVYKRFSEGMA